MTAALPHSPWPRRPAIRYIASERELASLETTATAHGWSSFVSPFDTRNDRHQFCVFAPSAEAFDDARAAAAKIARMRDVRPHRFAHIACSSCGQEFGPGNFGYSFCADHG